MARYRYSLMLFYAASIVLLHLLPTIRPLVTIGLFKMVGFFAMASLLAFVVLHSAQIRRSLLSRLKSRSFCFFLVVIESRTFIGTTDSRCAFNEPDIRLLFQRPPPFLSL